MKDSMKNTIEILEPEQIAQAQLFIDKCGPGGHFIEEIFGENWREVSGPGHRYATKFRITAWRRLFTNIKCLPFVYGKPLKYMLHPDCN
jgi:hypothetical protein